MTRVRALVRSGRSRHRVTASDVRAMAPVRLRFYPEARTAHLERLALMRPGTLLYRSTRYDFDLDALPKGARARRVGRLGLVKELLRSDLTHIEIPEPAALRSIPDIMLVVGVVRARWVAGRARVSVVSYAIENLDPADRLSGWSRLSPRAATVLVRSYLRWVIRSYDRISFGTAGAYTNYIGYVPELGADSSKNIVISGLSTATGSVAKVDSAVLFLGSFESRKGILWLLDEWPRVVDRLPGATLHVVGQGELESVVRAKVSRLDGARLTVAPKRESIFSSLAEAEVIVLPSITTRTWREQIGLPILEGLSHGCKVVTTSDTGIAGWLADHGHFVVPSDGNPSALGDSLLRALVTPRSPEAVMRDLPDQDGRIAADHWLFD